MRSYEEAKRSLEVFAESVPGAVVTESEISDEELKLSEIAATKLLRFVLDSVNGAFQKKTNAHRNHTALSEIKNLALTLNFSNSVIKFEMRSAGANFHYQPSLRQELRITANLHSHGLLRFSLKRKTNVTNDHVSSRTKVLRDNLWLIKPFVGAGAVQTIIDGYELAPMKPVAIEDLPTVFVMRANDEPAIMDLSRKIDLCDFLRKRSFLRSIEFGHTDWRTGARNQIVEVFDYFDENNDYPFEEALRLLEMILDNTSQSSGL